MSCSKLFLFYKLINSVSSTSCRYILKYWPDLTMNFELTGTLSYYSAVFVNLFTTISSWLVVAMTVDRLILTHYPLKASSLSTTKRTNIAVALIIILSCLYNGVKAYGTFEVNVIPNDCNGFWGIPLQVEREDGSVYIPIRRREEYKLYSIISNVLVMYIIPTSILVVCNILISRALNPKNQVRKSKPTAERGKTSAKRLGEIRLTKMIIVISVLFIVTNFPESCTRILWNFISPAIVAKIQFITNVLLMLNVVVNFIIYSLYNKKLFGTINSMFGRNSTSLTASKSDSSPAQKYSKTDDTNLSF